MRLRNEDIPILKISYQAVIGIVSVLNLISCDKIYLNQFAIEAKNESAARDVANKHQFIFLGQIGDLKGYYYLEHNSVHKRSIEKNHHHVQKLYKDKSILWVEQQHEIYRFKRDYISKHVDKRLSRTAKSAPRDFTDVLYSKQWYLHHGAVGSNDMNVIPVWERGYSGKGVVVTILDDGIQTDHPDLVNNYDPDASTDINDNDNNPMPRNNNDNKHGTRCAGEVASMAFNDYCGVGIAYNAKIGGVRMLDGRVTDVVEAKALGHNPQHVDIYSASWGPEDNGKTVDGPGRLAKLAFIHGIEKGRGGKGSVFVWASGNGGRDSDNCNCDGYTNSIYTLSISSATHKNAKPWYLEQCSSTLATTYSSGQPLIDPNVVTVDMDRTYIDAINAGKQADSRSLCTESHTGTSASAPMAAGMCALALEANPMLTWRDMQHIVVLTSRYAPLATESGWITNGINRKVSHKFGYGLMDGEKMVLLASTWKTVPKQHKCDSVEDSVHRKIPTSFQSKVITSIYTNGCKGQQSEVRYLEHVQATITLYFKPRGNLRIKLISPAGTHSTLLFPRPLDVNDGSFNNWPFLSVHFWSESPIGNWTLNIINAGVSIAKKPGKLFKWSLAMYGTYENPVPDSHSNDVNSIPDVAKPTYKGVCDPQCESCHGPGPHQCYKCRHFKMETSPSICVSSCPENYYVESRVCKLCHPSCGTCYGPHANDCQTCHFGSYLKQDELICISTCPSGYFTDEELKSCLLCDSKCKTCSKSPHECDKCADSLVMVGDHECISSCPDLSYKSPITNRCEKCSNDCLHCYGPTGTQCTLCKPGLYLHQGKCVNYCSQRTYADNDTFICYSCNPSCNECQSLKSCNLCSLGYKLKNSICRPTKGMSSCDESCTTCVGPSSTQCTSCPKSSYLQNNTCFSECPVGFYGDKENRMCLSCYSKCNKCHGVKIDECDECEDNFVLNDGRCLPNCPPGMYKGRGGICGPCDGSCATCISKNGCITCPDKYYYMSKECVQECPIGFHPTESGRCIRCHHTCSYCSGDGPNSCTSCRDGQVLNRSRCTSCSIDQYYDNVSQSCLQCHLTCKACSGPMRTDCESCSRPLHFDPLKHRCVQCCPPSVYSTYTCCICDPRTNRCLNHISDESKDSSSDDVISVINTTISSKFILTTVVISLSAIIVILFFIIFFILQYRSRRLRNEGYKPIPLISDNGIDKAAVSNSAFDEDEEIFYRS